MNITLDQLEELSEQLYKLLSNRRVVETLEADWWDKVEKLIDGIGSSLKTDVIKLTKEKYKRMQVRLRKLDALEAGGVDNWVGYSFAMEERCDCEGCKEEDGDF